MADAKDYGVGFGVSAVMGNWFNEKIVDDLQRGIGNYYDDFPKNKLLAMFETADGCIKFQEVKKAEPRIDFITTRMIATSKADPLDQLQTKDLKRSYILSDRSGPGGMVLHYREVI